MKYLAPLLPSLLAVSAAALPTVQPSIPELSVRDWSSIQSGFVGQIKSLSSWSWDKAEELVEQYDDELTKTKTDESDKTIWQELVDDTNSFSKLVKIINFVGDKAIEVLDDKDASITFFAPNNDALTPPEHHHHHEHHHDGDHKHDLQLMELMNTPSLAGLSAILDAEPTLTLDKGDDGDDDEKRKHRREVFRYIAGMVLKYHGVPHAFTIDELAKNSTVGTALKAHDGSFGGLHRRIKVERSYLPPAVILNGYAKVLVSDKHAKNGILHTLNAPLLPPPSIFETAYILPDFFSTLTSAVQGVHGRKFLDWSYDRNASSPGHPQFHGMPLTTLFAPDNKAFLALPFRLKLFLFSPFGEKALAKLLMYHAVPDRLVLSELQYHAHKAAEADGFSEAVGAWEYWGDRTDGEDPSFKKELEVPTALPNATLHLVIEKTKLPLVDGYKTSIKVNGQYAESIDIQARNGAIHVLGLVLIPPHHHDHDHHDHHGHEAKMAEERTWDNWEQWLPQWADADF